MEEDEYGAPFLQLLKIFAYKQLKDYRADASLPELDESQMTKLQQLTLVSLAAQNSTLPYDTIKEAVEVESTREMEDMIIDAIYLSLLTGTLDQSRSVLLTESCMGRDMEHSELPETIDALTAWLGRAHSLLATLDSGAQVAAARTKQAEEDAAALDESFKNAKKILELSLEDDLTSGGPGGEPEPSRRRRHR